MDKQHILGTGLSGLVGSKFVDQYKDQYEFQNLDLQSGVDITNPDSVSRAIDQSPANALVHMAAFTDATAAWNQRGDKNGVCYKVNVDGTRNIVDAAKTRGMYMIHISTAFVFDGKKEGMYVEEDPLSPIEWYGQTKADAEEIVRSALPTALVIRIDQPFRLDTFSQKMDTTHKLIQSLMRGNPYPQFTDHWFAPTVVEDLNAVLHWAIQTKPSGVLHVTTGQKVSDYEYAQLLVRELGLSVELKQGSLTEYLKTTQRPYQRNTALDATKVRATSGLSFMTIEQAVRAIDRSDLAV